MAARQTSSVYSDTFDLDDLLSRISKQTSEQREAAMRSLYQEIGELEKDILAYRQVCLTACKALDELRELTTRLRMLLAKTASSMRSDKNKYLANCTAF
ncbi:uncharacterized protein CTRU02_215473 [Colletotrichum truncatum]|uniref:Uncharacterized protein n=1 Tax=Colletotrichum truncatum TaxID=5467 RepID=A0ACC3YCI5_COLTU|nr:uncharacterized protein CTRU02_05584 [Colletotrichum truncatum]KAF6794027.1 hypothetical protein CTRU02_05584 [Colletotrichum truncatum]